MSEARRLFNAVMEIHYLLLHQKKGQTFGFEKYPKKVPYALENCNTDIVVGQYVMHHLTMAPFTFW